jgi:hypothetical protein
MATPSSVYTTVAQTPKDRQKWRLRDGFRQQSGRHERRPLMVQRVKPDD